MGLGVRLGWWLIPCSAYCMTDTSEDEEAGIVMSTPLSRRRPPASRRRRRLSTGRSLTGSEHGELLMTSPTDEEGSCSVVDARSVVSFWQTVITICSDFLGILRYFAWFTLAPCPWTYNLLVVRSGGTAPRYLQDVIQPVAEVTSRRRLRSASSSALLVPATRRSSLGDRAFAVAGPRACNSLPEFVTDCASPLTF